jgi:hypothetical protein
MAPAAHAEEGGAQHVPVPAAARLPAQALYSLAATESALAAPQEDPAGSTNTALVAFLEGHLQAKLPGTEGLNRGTLVAYMGASRHINIKQLNAALERMPRVPKNKVVSRKRAFAELVLECHPDDDALAAA